MPDLPQRLRLQRRKGATLQSLSPDGRRVVSVGRPSRWGNPFRLSEFASQADRAEAVANFRHLVESNGGRCGGSSIEQLRGAHLACWCKPDEPCHADVLLEIANA